MTSYKLTHLPDQTLLRELKSLVAQDRTTTALLIAHLGEVDARRLYAEAGYPSTFEWCVQTLHFSEDTAYKRIRVARTARQFPTVYEMLADGWLHVSGVVMLVPYLTPENADELLAAAAYKSKTGIEVLLAERFPQPDLPSTIEVLAPPSPSPQLAPGRTRLSEGDQTTPGSSAVPASPVPPLPVMPKVAPLAPQRFAIQCTVSQGTYEKLKHAQELLGHSVPSSDLAEVLDRALDALIVQLEKRKFAATDRPRPCRPSENPRQIPASVKREVWARDGGRCTFVSESGHRCEARGRLEYDHVEAVANGGHATVKGLRLRCRAHNQLAAEQAFGRDFMNAKRERAQREAAG